MRKRVKRRVKRMKRRGNKNSMKGTENISFSSHFCVLSLSFFQVLYFILSFFSSSPAYNTYTHHSNMYAYTLSHARTFCFLLSFLCLFLGLFARCFFPSIAWPVCRLDLLFMFIPLSSFWIEMDGYEEKVRDPRAVSVELNNYHNVLLQFPYCTTSSGRISTVPTWISHPCVRVWSTILLEQCLPVQARDTLLA